MASSATNLQDGGVEALQALFSSLNRGGSDNERPSQLSPEALQRLSEKLSEMTGSVPGPTQRGDTSGQLLNEEGLPIIDISEPVSDTGADYGTGSVFKDEPLVPIPSLTEAQLDIRRRERDRILDQLEREEEEERSREERREALQEKKEYEKRKERVKDDLDKLKSRKDMQKKMGKALLRSLAEDRDKEDKSKKAIAASPSERPPASSAEQKPEKKTSKSVSFTSDTKQIDATNPSSSKHSLSPGAGSQRVDSEEVAIMQPTVVERTPSSSTVGERKEPLSATPVSKPRPAEPQSRSSEPMKYATAAYSPSLDYSDSSDTQVDVDDDDVDSADEELEFARQQRELAMEYLERKQRMGNEFMQALANPSAADPADWNQENVPLEATLSHPPPKPTQSRFRSSLPKSQSTSTVLPAAQMQNSIRFGKLENDQLAGGPEGDSDDEPPKDGMAEILELLRKGDLNGVENIGPAAPNSDATSNPAPTTTAKLSRYDPSKPAPFKPTRPGSSSLNPRGEDGLGIDGGSPPGSRPETPTSHDMRSSPKVPASPAVIDSNTGPGPSALRNPPLSTVVEAQPGQTRVGLGIESEFQGNRPWSTQVWEEKMPPRARQPPTIVSAAVKESAPRHTQASVDEGANEETQKPKKVSRFKAGRG